MTHRDLKKYGPLIALDSRGREYLLQYYENNIIATAIIQGLPELDEPLPENEWDEKVFWVPVDWFEEEVLNPGWSESCRCTIISLMQQGCKCGGK